MNETHHTPTFNMKVVVRETGIKPDTLRAWERRYGIPDPKRTPGGHRLYSQYEIDMLKWLISQQKEGLTIGRAIELWQALLEEGTDPLEDSEEIFDEPPTITTVVGEELSSMQDAWLEACMAFDEYGAQKILSQAFAQFPIEIVCIELLQKSLTRIGQMWYEGKASVQQEHFCSALSIRQLEALISSAAPYTQDVRVLVACPPQEQHTFPPLMLTLLFRRRGWNVVYLGANVPTARLETAVQSVNPQIVIIPAQTLHTAGQMLPMAQLLNENDIIIAYGGAVFTYLENARKHIPAHFLGNDMIAAPDRVWRLIQSKKPNPIVKPVGAQYLAAKRHFLEKRSLIDMHVQNALKTPKADFSYITNANEDLGNSIAAALTLGDMDLMMANISWVQGLLMNYHYRMPEDMTGKYLDAYQEAIQNHLGRPGEIIREWFLRLAKSSEITRRMRRVPPDSNGQ